MVQPIDKAWTLLIILVEHIENVQVFGKAILVNYTEKSNMVVFSQPKEWLVINVG